MATRQGRSPLRVLVVTNNAPQNAGGVPVAVEMLRSGLAFRQAEPVVVTPDGFRTIPGLTFNGCPITLPYSRRAMRSFSPTPDAVHVQHPIGLGFSFARAAAKRKTPVVWSYHTRFEHYAHYLRLPAGIASAFLRRRFARLAKLTSLALAPTQAAAAELAEAGFANVAVLPWPAAQGFHQATGDASLQRLTRSKRVLIAATRFAPEKRCLELVSGAASALQRNPDWGLVIVGDGPLRKQAETAALATGLNGRVRFLGQRAHRDMPRLFASADLTLSASVSETQGFALTEAQAAGVPAVSAAFPGAGEIVEHGGSGIVSNPGVADLASATSSLMRDPARRRAFARRARERARAFHPLRWSETLMQYYGQAIQTARRPK